MVKSKESLRVVVIGAGMSGILCGVRLQQEGINRFTIYEKGDRAGGTWRENTYPGLSCDIPSHVYSYSFEPNPDWSHQFSPGSEILEYTEHTAEKYGVMPFIRFGEEITHCEYDGKLHELDCIVLATGFKAHQFMRPMQVVGRDGIRLDDVCKRKTPAHRSVSMPDFRDFQLIG